MLIENKSLRNSIQIRDMGTQSSPTYLGYEGTRVDNRENDEMNAKRAQGKGKKQRQLTDEMEGITKAGTSEPDPGTARANGKEQEEDWIKVERNRKAEEKRKLARKKKEETEELEKRKEEREEEVSRRRIRAPAPPKTEAVIIKTSETKTFADLFKQIKTKAGDQIKGRKSFQMVRKSRGGDLVIEMEKGVDSSRFEKLQKMHSGKNAE